MSYLSLMKTEFQFHKIRRVLEMDRWLWPHTMWLCLHYDHHWTGRLKMVTVVNVMDAWVCAQLLQSCPPLCDPMDYIARQTPLSMGFSRQGFWSRLPCPPPVDLPNPGIESRSPTLQTNSLPSGPLGKPSLWLGICRRGFFPPRTRAEEKIPFLSPSAGQLFLFLANRKCHLSLVPPLS